MNRLHIRLTYFFMVLTMLLCLAMNTSSVLAQADQAAQAEKKDEQVNLDTKLYLIVGTNQDVGEAKLPALLDEVGQELRASLPFKNYRLTATLINRVKSDGRLSLRWVGGPLLSASAAASNNTPSFNDFRINTVKIYDDPQGRKMIRMDGFNFGSRIPIVTYNGVASNGPASPVINYQDTGLTTDISMREDQPVVVGTLNVGPSGDAIILVMVAKRAMK
jgi:hypothetical protein